MLTMEITKPKQLKLPRYFRTSVSHPSVFYVVCNTMKMGTHLFVLISVLCLCQSLVLASISESPSESPSMIPSVRPSSPTERPSFRPTLIVYEVQSDDSQPGKILSDGAIAGIAVAGFFSSIIIGFGCYRFLIKWSDKDDRSIAKIVPGTKPQTPYEA